MSHPISDHAVSDLNAAQPLLLTITAVFALGCLSAGCGDDTMTDGDGGAGRDARGTDAPGFDAGGADAQGTDVGPGADGGPRADGGGIDAGPRPPLEGRIPGGERSAAPIVGCEDAERPAQRMAAAEAMCESDATCWYVSVDGDDSAEGTFEAPFRRPQVAVQRAGAGDVIYLRGGVYTQEHAYEGRNRTLFSVGHIEDGGETYDVAEGTEEAPIRIRSFPGERACSDGAGGIGIGSSATNISWWRIENLTIRGARISIGGGSSRGQTRDIVILNNEVYGYAVGGGDNPGLVRINRGDQGGPARITIESNILHDLGDGELGNWNTTNDAQHFGSVTTLSCETYLGLECGGTGAVTIRNNHIYNVPQAFFFKNPSAGPYLIEGNVIHHTQRLGGWIPSNITFENNLVYQSSGIGLGSGDHREGSDVFERAGHSLVLQNNTFIGFDRLLRFGSQPSGHVVRGNIIQGLEISISERTWDQVGVIAETIGSPITDIRESEIASGNDFDDNCFVTDTADFIAFGRRYEGGLDHLTLADLREQLGYEVASDVVPTSGRVFEDFGSGDYRVADGGECGARGAAAPEWFGASE